MKRFVFRILSVFFIILGIIGIFLPVMPTVPFLLAALYFAANDPAVKNFLYTTPMLREYLDYSNGKKPLSMIQRIASITLLWLSLAVSFFLIDILWCRIILIGVGIGVSIHLLLIGK